MSWLFDKTVFTDAVFADQFHESGILKQFCVTTKLTLVKPGIGYDLIYQHRHHIGFITTFQWLYNALIRVRFKKKKYPDLNCSFIADSFYGDYWVWYKKGTNILHSPYGPAIEPVDSTDCIYIINDIPLSKNGWLIWNQIQATQIIATSESGLDLNL